MKDRLCSLRFYAFSKMKKKKVDKYQVMNCACIYYFFLRILLSSYSQAFDHYQGFPEAVSFICIAKSLKIQSMYLFCY